MELAENTRLGAPDQGDWLTVAQFAAKLGCKPVTVYAAIDAGLIEGVIRIGKRRGYRIPRESYPAFVESRRITAPAESTAAA
jgi:excisionase family DNA binding protein